jgi:hypothetical protein
LTGGLLAAVVSADCAQAAAVLKTYNLEVYQGSTLVLSGTFSVNVEADTANVSAYNQQATLQSANLTLGSTTFSLANGNIGLPGTVRRLGTTTSTSTPSMALSALAPPPAPA